MFFAGLTVIITFVLGLIITSIPLCEYPIAPAPASKGFPLLKICLISFKVLNPNFSVLMFFNCFIAWLDTLYPVEANALYISECVRERKSLF